jgi:hypothetical protein
LRRRRRLLIAQRNGMRTEFTSEPSVSYLVDDTAARVMDAAPTDFLEMRADNLLIFEARLALETQFVEEVLNAGAVFEASEASVRRSLNTDERLAIAALAELATGVGGEKMSEVDSLLVRACLLSSHGYEFYIFKLRLTASRTSLGELQRKIDAAPPLTFQVDFETDSVLGRGRLLSSRCVHLLQSDFL